MTENPFDLERFKCLPHPRKNQADIIPQIIESFKKKKYVILEAPTGSGKSFVAVSISNYYSEKYGDDLKYGTYILVHQKILQDQYVNENWSKIFSENGKIASVYSADNYVCHKLGHLGVTCAEVASYRKKDASCCPIQQCTYTKNREEFIKGTIGVTNIQYFMNMAAYTTKLQYKRLLVIDEAHNTENNVMNFISIDISEFLCSQRLKIRIPEYKSDEQIISWIEKEYKPNIIKKISEIESETTNLIDLKNRTDEQEENLKNKLQDFDFWDKYLCKLNRALQKWDPKLWTIDTSLTKTGYKIVSLKPIIINDYTYDLLFKQTENVLMMSATILDKSAFCKSIGLDENQVDFYKLPSTFPPEKRPIYFFPTGSMSAKNINETLPILVKSIEHLLEHHLNNKGIIHTNSYKIAEYIKKNINKKHIKRLLTHKPDNRDEILQKHISSSKPTVLLTPSMAEGVDLKDDLSRFQIICKIPFPYLGDKRVQLKMKLQTWWYSYQTVKLLVQSLGRSVRSSDDFAISYILDEDWSYFYSQNKNSFPDYIKEAIVE